MSSDVYSKLPCMPVGFNSRDAARQEKRSMIVHVSRPGDSHFIRLKIMCAGRNIWRGALSSIIFHKQTSFANVTPKNCPPSLVILEKHTKNSWKQIIFKHKSFGQSTTERNQPLCTSSGRPACSPFLCGF